MASEFINSLENFTYFNEPESSERIKEVARKELGETEERKKECLMQLKRLIREHRVACITREEFLLRFLRTKKFQVQRSFEAVRNYAHQRVVLHERLMKLQPAAVKNCLRHKVAGFLPYRDSKERLIFYCEQHIWNQEICSDEDMGMFFILLLTYAVEKPSSQTTGIIGVFNKCVPVTNIPYLLRNASHVLKYIFNSLPARFPKLHLINSPVLMKTVVRLLDPFLPKKIKGRLAFHGEDREEFFESLAPCILPEEFGGTLGLLNNDHLIDEILSFLQKMKDEQRYFVPQPC